MIKRSLLLVSLPVLLGLALFLISAKPIAAQSVTPGQTSHYSGYKAQQPDGTMSCEGFSTNLTTSDYKVDIKYKGDPSCCGLQTDGDGIWIGGNSASQIGVDFIENRNRLQFGTLGPTQIATTFDGQWHTYSVTKIGTTATLSLDGQVIATENAVSASPDTMALGGKCTAPDLNNWNNFWYDVTFYNLSACTANTTSAALATSSNPTDFRTNYGNILQGQTTAYVKGTNSAGVLSSLRETPNNWSIISPVNNQVYPVSILGWQLGPHTVTATGGGGSYCSTTGAATFNCISQPPSITPSAPNGLITAGPTSYIWTGTYSSSQDFGMDSCGANASTSDDRLTVNLYDGSGCQGSPLGSPQCDNLGPSASAIDPTTHSASCPNQYSFPTITHNYSWQIVAQNGPDPVNNKISLCTNFTYQPAAKPWWQTDSGHAYGEQGIKSLIPCTGPACLFSLAGFGAPGIAVYNTGSANFNGAANLSQSGWLAGGAPFLPDKPTFDLIYRHLPVATTPIPAALDQPTLSSLISAAASTDAYYLEYLGSSPLTISGLTVGDKKVVVYAKNPGLVNLSGDITVNHGKGFFGLITTAPIQISPAVTHLDTLLFTENSVSTGANTPGNDQPLVVNGVVIAQATVNLERDLDRTKTTGQNNTHPAEKFIFAPDYLFVMPRSLRRFQYQLNEVSPTQ